jgi:hypothetical protein
MPTCRNTSPASREAVTHEDIILTTPIGMCFSIIVYVFVSLTLRTRSKTGASGCPGTNQTIEASPQLNQSGTESKRSTNMVLDIDKSASLVVYQRLGEIFWAARLAMLFAGRWLGFDEVTLRSFATSFSDKAGDDRVAGRVGKYTKVVDVR